MAQHDGGAHDGGIFRQCGDVADEGAVHLQLMHRQRLQVGQRGLAGAVVVDRQLHAQVGQLVQVAQRQFRLVHQRALGDFQADAVRCQRVARQQVGNQSGQTGVQQVQRRQVDRRHQRPAVGAPAGGLGHHVLQQPGGDFVDEPGLFGERDESRRRHQALGGVPPAQQRFDGGHFTPCQVVLGLEEGNEFVACQRVAHFANQGQVFMRRIDCQIGHQGMAAVALFGGAHRQRGAAQQRSQVAVVLRVQRDAQAAADVDALVVQRQGLSQVFDHGLGKTDGLVTVRAFEQKGELVTPQAYQQEGRCAWHAEQALADFAQQAIAHAVAQRVVDHAETVDVQHQHSAASVVWQSLKVFEQPGSVGQTGQVVLIGQTQDLVFTADDAVAHHTERTQQLAHLVAPTGRNRAHQVAGGDGFGHAYGLAHRSHDAARHVDRQGDASQQRRQCHHDQHGDGMGLRNLQLLQVDAHALALHGSHGGAGLQQFVERLLGVVIEMLAGACRALELDQFHRFAEVVVIVVAQLVQLPQLLGVLGGLHGLGDGFHGLVGRRQFPVHVAIQQHALFTRAGQQQFEQIVGGSLRMLVCRLGQKGARGLHLDDGLGDTRQAAKALQ